MRAVLTNANESLLEERRRLGIDHHDECWEGEWHLVNPPKRWHPRLQARLIVALAPLAEAAGLEPYGDSLGVFAASDDFRVPDLAFVHPADGFDDGVRSAALVIELRSPGDESYQKLPFYASRGIAEVFIIHEDRRVELYRLRDDGEMIQVESEDGGVRSAVLRCALHTVDGPAVRISWAGGTADV